MSALSIRHMNFTLHEMERIQWAKEAEEYKNTPRVDWFDWLITRPAKRGNKRVTVTVLHGFTKADFAKWWMKHGEKGWTARVFFNPQKFARLAEAKRMSEQVAMAQELADSVTINWTAALLVLDMCEGTETSPIISGGEILELGTITREIEIPF